MSPLDKRQHSSPRGRARSYLIGTAIFVAGTWVGSRHLLGAPSTTQYAVAMHLTGSGGGGGEPSPLPLPLPAQVCKLVEYVPSRWEQEWVDGADAIAAQESQCKVMRDAGDLSAQWLAGVAACQQDGGCAPDQVPLTVFSRLVRSCSPAAGAAEEAEMAAAPVVVVEDAIEPLVGHMRHPHAIPGCEPHGVIRANVEDRTYIMLLGDKPAAVRARYPGRAILVDAGTNKYRTSLGWLVPSYAAAGVHFDAIYAWEATKHNASYWDAVPADVQPRLHFYNAPVTPEPGSAMNPVDWIRDMHRPGDFIVFKLDIDRDDIESAFIKQILDWPAAGEVIAEMFFEKHYASADMKRHFGTPATDYPGALRLMQSLRAHGVRAHFWP